jgi:hypothetical protein
MKKKTKSVSKRRRLNKNRRYSYRKRIFGGAEMMLHVQQVVGKFDPGNREDYNDNFITMQDGKEYKYTIAFLDYRPKNTVVHNRQRLGKILQCFLLTQEEKDKYRNLITDPKNGVNINEDVYYITSQAQNQTVGMFVVNNTAKIYFEL